MSINIPTERYEEIKCIVVRMFIKHRVSCVPINGFEIAGGRWKALRKTDGAVLIGKAKA